MYILRGKQISKGISIGKIHLYRKNRINIHKVQIENVAFEMRRFQEAQQLSVGQLKVLYEQAVQKVGHPSALPVRSTILTATLMVIIKQYRTSQR